MTDEQSREALRSEANFDNDEQLKKLLKEAVPPATTEQLDVVRLVQHRLREQSQGKFYGDGWSTSKDPPVATYLVTTVVMLFVTLAIYVLLRGTYGLAQQ